MTKTPPQITTVGILGAGKVGTAIGRLATNAGYTTLIATAKPKEEIQMLTEFMVPGARAVDTHEIATADLVVVSIPLRKYQELDPDLLDGKVVIDTMNYWAPTDGTIDAFEDPELSSSEIVAKHLAQSTVVRTLNHIGYHDMDEDHRPAGAPDRRALAVAADDEEAKQLVMNFIDTVGFDPVDAGTLNDARAMANGTEIFNGSHNSRELTHLLQLAKAQA
ncbi:MULTISPECIES: NADPH-dependent F420 reductase [Corynebacterium]|uniref:Putative F420-dependent NADP oxidoreductase n=1 Tax=Corynebacterium pilosum TaxID=35756 RepID=A0A376CLD6_9CORY|nr:NAD(P)-binding domain-containing protein [Corynebacterium pilosum]STC69115.1 putative F420-dependent NADP oxidoreductase [Corynebacterium pilosum]